ncbi:MAG: 4'-phosphopantetheinyl transferase superfamily protein [Bacteroidia bacterium]|nr:4'-phosphopantetheinyl transferase superfamily protein [Bacteroidia bacterium]MDW8334390.1 4'-phosphopantetheinyl transferase superfamily protein [Bacteroidia bacterium]
MGTFLWFEWDFALGVIFDDVQGDKGAFRRRMARECLRRLTGGREFEPVKNERGAPVCDHGFISLSHPRGAAAAAFHPSVPVGVDVERLDPRRVSDVYQKFMSPGERERFERNRAVEFFFSVWSVKEAMYKIVNNYIEETSFRRELCVEREFYESGRGMGLVERPGFRARMDLRRAFYGDWVFCGATLLDVETNSSHPFLRSLHAGHSPHP